LGRRPPRLVRGEVVGLRKDRSEASLRALLTTRLEARQRAAVDAVCTDLHRPYVNVVAEVMPRAKIVFRQISRAATRGRRAR
jgi:transposase